MEEETVEHDLEERMYAALHYVDETRETTTIESDAIPNFDDVQQSSLRRYWRINEKNTTYTKVNTSSHKTNNPPNKITTSKESNNKELDKSIPKPTNNGSSSSSNVDLTLFSLPVPDNIKKSIEILETEDKNNVVELESSDEDEVVEVVLSPKPTITIESSDEDDTCISTLPTKQGDKTTVQTKPTNDREVMSSPVPSTVSSISDEFIRGDCIALNISSKHPNNHSFDLRLHGSDLEQTPTKKRKKKKAKDATSTPTSTSNIVEVDECFATPKSKAKNKKQKTKSYQVSNISVPSADVYDSDSNQSIIDGNKSISYEVTDKSLPNTDVYETDSNQSEIIKDNSFKVTEIMVSDVDSSEQHSEGEISIYETPTKDIAIQERNKVDDVTNLSIHDDSIKENIVMANVTGFVRENDSHENVVANKCSSKCGSTKIPAILNEDLDFDNLKGNKMCKRRRYSLTALRAEMEKFYNESWGGEDFNHREIQKNMSRDKSLWAIDPKDRMPALAKRKLTCNVCNRVGHKDDTCRSKTPICYMCGSTGHYEPRCPKKICVNCGSPNHIYTTMCRNCSNWNSIKCAECGQRGHPSSHCPDVWRRYHNTLSLNVPLEEDRQLKKHHQMCCSGCTRRGHLVHTCRLSLPFSGLPIYSPYVSLYRPVYHQPISTESMQNIETNNERSKQQKKINQDVTPRNERYKRQSKSPIAAEFVCKKRNISTDESKTPNPQRKRTQSKENPAENILEMNNTNKTGEKKDSQSESAPDFIAVPSSNHDEKGQVIQDNEVSDTSEVITSARIYITSGVGDLLKTEDGQEWMKKSSAKNNITIENPDFSFYISIKGSVGNQEAFQSELRDWIASKQTPKEHRNSESDANTTTDVDENSQLSDNIPKNRNNVLRKISKALDSLKTVIGEPKLLYKELTFLRNRQQQLLTQHVISPKQLSNNRGNINEMLRKLNMVLLGQAGLADGTKHLNELYSLQDKLINYRQKNIPTSLRKEIGEHFHCIFTAIPREDYVELLSKYYNKSPAQTKKAKRKVLKISPNIMENKKLNRKLCENKINDEGQKDAQNLLPFKVTRYEKARNKLIFIHSRLMQIKPLDSTLKKAKVQLMKQLHCNIASMGNKANMSIKTFEKARKVQEQAQELLTKLEFRPRV